MPHGSKCRLPGRIFQASIVRTAGKGRKPPLWTVGQPLDLSSEGPRGRISTVPSCSWMAMAGARPTGSVMFGGCCRWSPWDSSLRGTTGHWEPLAARLQAERQGLASCVRKWSVWRGSGYSVLAATSLEKLTWKTQVSPRREKPCEGRLASGMAGPRAIELQAPRSLVTEGGTGCLRSRVTHC